MLLIDGDALFWRAHYYLPDYVLESPEGLQHVGALSEGFPLLHDLLRMHPGQKLVVAWDGDSSWRREILPEYGTRALSPVGSPRVLPQLEIAQQTLACLGVEQRKHPRYESRDWAGVLLPSCADERSVWASFHWGGFSLLSDKVCQIRFWWNGRCDLWTPERLKRRWFSATPDVWASVVALYGDLQWGVPRVRKRMGIMRCVHFARNPWEIRKAFRRSEKEMYYCNLEVAAILREPPADAQIAPPPRASASVEAALACCGNLPGVEESLRGIAEGAQG